MNSKNSEFLDDIFEQIDNRIRYIVDNNENIESELMDVYFDFFNKLKEKAGTSSGFTGLSEYLFFTAVKYYLKKRGIKLKIEGNTNDTKRFESNTVLLTHDINISKFTNNKLKQRPDIAIFKKKGDNYKPIAVFQIKIYLTNSDSLDTDIEKMKEVLKINSSAICFNVLFHKPSKKHLERNSDYYKSYPKNAFIISKTELPIFESNRISFNETMQKIIGVLK